MPLAALSPFSWDHEHKFSFPSLSQLTHLNFQDTDCIKWPPLFQHSKAPPFPQIFLQRKWRNFARVIPSCQWQAKWKIAIVSTAGALVVVTVLKGYHPVTHPVQSDYTYSSLLILLSRGEIWPCRHCRQQCKFLHFHSFLFVFLSL